MEFRILGPLEVCNKDRVLDLREGKQRALLAILLLHANEVVARDRLIDELWGGNPPPTAAKIVQNYISELRKRLEAARVDGSEGVLRTRANGYELRVEPGELDADRFESLVEEGRRALGDDRPDKAADKLREALSLWRGAPLAEFAFESFAQNEISRLQERRLTAIEERIDADLALGQHADLIGELETLVAGNPLRERLRCQLMLALYRCGRQAEALTVYRDARRTLTEELGIEPGPNLRRLERAVLVQDSALDLPKKPEGARSELEAPAGTILGGRRRRLVLLACAALLLGAVLAAGFLLTRNDQQGGSAAERPGAVRLPVRPNSVAVIDPKTNEVIAAVPVGIGPGPIAVGGGSVWIANVDDQTVSRIDPATRRVVKTVGLGFEPTGIAAGYGAVWVAGGFENAVWRVDTADNVVRGKLRIRNALGPLPVGYERGPSAVAVGYGAVWLAHGREVSRIRPKTGAVLATIRAGGRWSGTVAGSGAVATGEGAVWVADNVRNAVSRVDPRSNTVAVEIPVVAAPSGIAAGEGAVWVTFDLDETLWRIDPVANRVTRVIHAGDDVTRVAIGQGAVWAVNDENGIVTRFDPFSNRRVATIEVGHRLTGIAVTDDAIWVSVHELGSS